MTIGNDSTEEFIFKLLDSNGNNVLDIKELAFFLKNINCSQKQISDVYDLIALLCDFNDNGVIEKKEAQKVFKLARKQEIEFKK